jgi:hypothetical protein
MPPAAFFGRGGGSINPARVVYVMLRGWLEAMARVSGTVFARAGLRPKVSNGILGRPLFEPRAVFSRIARAVLAHYQLQLVSRTRRWLGGMPLGWLAGTAQAGLTLGA